MDDLRNEEKQKLDTFCEFIFADTFAQTCSKKRFIESVKMLLGERVFDMKATVKDIVKSKSKNSWMMTTSHIEQAFLGYKKNSKDYKLETKNFFAYIFSEVIKQPGEQIGRILPGTVQKSSSKYKNRERLNNIKVFAKGKEILGFYLEYDHICECTFLPNDVEEYDTKIDLNLKKFTYSQQPNNDDPDNYNSFDENDSVDGNFYDFITHIFGTFTTKIEFIGFKSARGKLYSTGKRNVGKAFMVGSVEQKFHYMKLGIKEGISYIKPQFVQRDIPPIEMENENMDEGSNEDQNEEEEEEEENEDGDDGENEYNEDENNEDDLSDLDDDYGYDWEDDCNDFDYDKKGDSYNELSNEEGSSGEGENEEDDYSSDEEYGNKKKKKEKTLKKEKDFANKNFNEIVSNPDNFDNFVDLFSRDLESDIYKKKKQQEYINNKKLQKDKSKKKEVEQYKDMNEFNENDYNEEGDFGIEDDNIDYDDIITDEIFNNKINKKQKNNQKNEEENYNLDGFFNEVEEDSKSINKKNDSNQIKINYNNERKKKKNASQETFEIGGFFDNQSTTTFNTNKEKILNDKIDKIKKKEEEKKKIEPVVIEKKKERVFRIDLEYYKNAWKKFSSGLRRKLTKLVLYKTIVEKAYDSIKISEEKNDKNLSLDQKVSLLSIFKQFQGQKFLLKILFPPKKEEPKPIKKEEPKPLKKEEPKPIKKEEPKPIKKEEPKPIKKEEPKPIKKEEPKPIKKEEPKPIKKEEPKPIKKEEPNSVNKEELEAKEKARKEEEKKKLEEKKKEEADKQKKIELDKKNELLNKNIEAMKEIKKKEEEELKKKIIEPVIISDLKLPKYIAIYRRQALPKGSQFVDDVFKAETNSLCNINEEKAFVIPPGVLLEEISGWERLSWKRANDIFKNGNYQVFVDKIEAADILQGQLGNCYFLSSIASLATYPELVTKLYLFQNKSNEGVYGIYLRLAGIWRLVLVDDFFPCTITKKPAFTSSNGPELWVLLLEKAWAKVCGSYARTIAGFPSEVFTCLTNAFTESINLNKRAPSTVKDDIWEKINKGIEQQFIMTAATGGDNQEIYTTVGLQNGHAYSLISSAEVEDAGQKVRLVKIRNPWGEEEWSGDWADNSNKWKPNLKTQLNLVQEDDGTFWMNFEDFMNYFTNICICKLYTNYNYTYLKFNKSKANNMNLSELTLKQETHIFIQMHQRNKRFVTKSAKYIEEQSIMHLLLLDDKFNYIESKWSFDEVTMAIETTLKKGKYYILSDINYRFSSEEVYGYSITTYCKDNVSLNESKVNPQKAFKEGIVSYAKTVLKPMYPEELFTLNRTDAAQCFKQTVKNAFPYNFFIFINSCKDLSFQGVVEGKNKTNCGFYSLEQNVEIKENKVLVDVLPGMTELILVRYFKQGTRIIYTEKNVPKGINNGEYCPMFLKK